MCAPSCVSAYVSICIPLETLRMGPSSYIPLSCLCSYLRITSETPRTGLRYSRYLYHIYNHAFIFPRKPLERVRVISYISSPSSSFLSRMSVIRHAPHESPSCIYPDYVPKYRKGGGELNVSHCSHLYRHIMFGNRGDVGTEFLPRIYSRRDKFPIIDFLHFSVTS